MDRPTPTPQTMGAFLIGLIAIGLAFLIVDQTPLLVEPSPDLDWPLGLLGGAGGLWAASRITRLPAVASRKFGRIALFIMLPLWLGFGLAALGDRVQESISFRQGRVEEAVTVPVVEKSSRTGRRSRRIFYDVDLANPFGGSAVSLRIDEATFRRIQPGRECATILVERAPDGAARLVRPLRWHVPCPGTGQPG